MEELKNELGPLVYSSEDDKNTGEQKPKKNCFNKKTPNKEKKKGRLFPRGFNLKLSDSIF